MRGNADLAASDAQHVHQADQRSRSLYTTGWAKQVTSFCYVPFSPLLAVMQTRLFKTKTTTQNFSCSIKCF